MLFSAEAMSEATVRVLIAVVSVLGTGIFGVFSLWWNRRVPSYVEVRDEELWGVMRIAKDFQSKVTAKFNDIPVARMAQVKFSISNPSFEPISDITLLFGFPAGTTALEWSFDRVSLVANKTSGNEFEVKIPLLNSKKHHRDEIRGSIICDGEAQDYTVKGSGPGWSAKRVTFYDMINRSERKRNAVTVGSTLFMFLTAAALQIYVTGKLIEGPWWLLLAMCGLMLVGGIISSKSMSSHQKYRRRIVRQFDRN